MINFKPDKLDAINFYDGLLLLLPILCCSAGIIERPILKMIEIESVHGRRKQSGAFKLELKTRLQYTNRWNENITYIWNNIICLVFSVVFMPASNMSKETIVHLIAEIHQMDIFNFDWHITLNLFYSFIVFSTHSYLFVCNFQSISPSPIASSSLWSR